MNTLKPHDTIDAAHRRLEDLQDKQPLRFRFRCHETWFDGRLDQATDGKGSRLRMMGDLGIIPYTSEAPAERSRLLALAAWREGGTPHFAIGRHGRLHMLCQSEITERPTATKIFAEAATLMLKAKPYLDLAREARSGAKLDAEVPPALTLPSQPRYRSSAR